MPEQLSIAEITAAIAAAHARVLAAIAPLTAAQLTAPVLGADGWSVKDVLAHLEFWDRRLLHAIGPEEWPEHWQDGAPGSRRFPPPIADIPYDEAWLEAVNTRIYTRNRDRDLHDVQAAFARTRARLLAAVAALTPHEVYDPDGLSAGLGEPFAEMLLGAYEHYAEHAEELEAHVSTLGGFAARPLAGDFIVTAQVRMADAPVEASLGWAARARSDENGPYVRACLHRADLPALEWRRAAGGPVERVSAPASTAGADVVQLERRGSTFIMSVARFGEPFTAVEIKDVDLGGEVQVGLFADGAGEGEAAGAFRNVRFIKPAAPGFDRAKDPFASRLELLDVLTGAREVIYEAPYVLEAPNWTRDGAALIYNSGGRLYRFDLATRTPAPIDTGDAVRNNNDHVLSFDGEMLAISSHDERGDSRVHIVPLAGGQPRRVTPVGHSFLHGWSPDGKFLVYTGYRAGVFDIYRIPVEGGAEDRLTDSPGLDDGPEYTPDGQYIYFNSTRSGRMQIWRMRPDGSEPEQLTDDDCDNWFPHISPDGEQVVFLSYLPGEVEPHDHPAARRCYLRLMPPDGALGGGAKVIAYLYGGQGTINVPSWSPDSKRIAFVSNTVPSR